MASLGFEIRGQPAEGRDRPAGRVAMWLFLAFCCIYLGTARGVLDTVDDVAMLRVTQALVTTGSVAVPPETPGAMPGVDGHWYTRYGIGPSLLAVPFYLVSSRLPVEPPRLAPYDPHGFVMATPVAFAVTLIGTLCVAASVALVYLTCRTLEFGHVASLLTALALGLGTFAWHYARTFMSEPPSMLAAIVAFFALARFGQRPRVRWALLSGAACGGLVLLRVGNAVLVPALGLWLLWLATRQTGSARWASVGAWLTPILAVGVLLAMFNTVRFGTPLETGYADQAQAFTTPWYVGAYGLLLSSGKGVVVYAPIVVAGIVGWVELARRQTAAAVTMAVLVGAYIVFYARFDWWYGGGPWGPRFVTVILPFLCLGLAALASTRSAPARVVLVALAVASVGVQILSLAVPYLPYEAQTMQDAIAYERLVWQPDASPVVAHVRSLVRAEYPIDLALTYYPWPWLVWLQPTVLVAGFGLLGAAAWSDLRAPRRRRVAMSEVMPA